MAHDGDKDAGMQERMNQFAMEESAKVMMAQVCSLCSCTPRVYLVFWYLMRSFVIMIKISFLYIGFRDFLTMYCVLLLHDCDLLSSYFMTVCSYFVTVCSCFMTLCSCFMTVCSCFMTVSSCFMTVSSYFLTVCSCFMTVCSYFMTV